MADFDWTQLIGPAIEVGGGLAGRAMSEGDRQEQLNLLKGLLAKYQGIEDPRFSNVAPDTVGPSELGRIQSDPALQAQQFEVDAGLKGVVDAGGLSLEDRAAQSQLYDKLARQTSGQNAAIRNNLAARGALNSGAATAMQLANAQQGAQQAADAARDTAAGAQANALRAMQQRYANASQMDDAQYQRKASAARAADAIAAHNASARRQAGIYNNGLLQQQFSNKVTKVAGQRGPANDLAGYYGDEAQNKANIGATGGRAFGAIDYTDPDERRRRAARARADAAWDEG